MCEDTETHGKGREDRYIKMEAETRGRQPQTKEYTGLPEATRGKAATSTKRFSGVCGPANTLTLDL